MFSHLPTPTLDPILSLSVAYRNDPRPEKVDLGIGVYKNSQGETPIMRAVQQAQDRVVATQKTKSYVGLAGCEEFNRSMLNLVLGESLVNERVTAIQTPGASGALRMLGDLMRV
ncbi:aminotransferase class I/II-fold pyridoxal phosphate-dependent enzyme, partial [Vibrio furnissii]